MGERNPDSKEEAVGFRALDEKSLVEYIKSTPAITAALGINSNSSSSSSSLDPLTIKEVGDGNLNFVYIVLAPAGSVVIKQVQTFYFLYTIVSKKKSVMIWDVQLQLRPSCDLWWTEFWLGGSLKKIVLIWEHMKRVVEKRNFILIIKHFPVIWVLTRRISDEPSVNLSDFLFVCQLDKRLLLP